MTHPANRALLEAIRAGDPAGFELAIAQGAEPGAGCRSLEFRVPGHAGSAIHVAAQYERMQVVRRLLTLGVDVNSQCRHYEWNTITEQTTVRHVETPLCIAVSRGHRELVDLLWAQGADLNLYVPLYDTLTCEDTELLRLLVNKGADVTARRGSLSLLAAAVECGNLPALRLLHEKGARFSTHRSLQGLLQRSLHPELRDWLAARSPEDLTV